MVLISQVDFRAEAWEVGMLVSSYGPLDGALERLAGYGPGLANGNFSHAPMVAEALCALGRPEAVMPWIERYQERIAAPTSDSGPPARQPVRPAQWRRAPRPP